MARLPQISESALDAMCRALADAATHKEVAILLAQCSISEQGGQPKWQRMLLALRHRQTQDGCGNNVVAFLCAILHPSRFEGRLDEQVEFRTTVNYQLAFYGLSIDERGDPRRVARASTVSEAQARANELREELVRREVHADVLRFCKAEFLEQNYFHCVLEATKSVAQRLRDLTGLGGDGAVLVDGALGVKSPRLAINTLQEDTEQSEQKGLGNLIKGAFGVFRNVTAHAPKILWAVNKRDALDALSILSHIHRRLDNAVEIPRVP